MLELNKWQVIFDSLQSQHADPRVVDICHRMLEEHEIPVPEDMAEILAAGARCACSSGGDGTDSVS